MSLILDHINGNNKDDRLENLRWVCPNCNQQLETTGNRNQYNKSYRKRYYCIDCKKELKGNWKRCRKCSNKYQMSSVDKIPVDRDTLKQLIRTDPFTQIGRMYSVTDNTIRKWCAKFNLPKKSSDIKKYTDEE